MYYTHTHKHTHTHTKNGTSRKQKFPFTFCCKRKQKRQTSVCLLQRESENSFFPWLANDQHLLMIAVSATVPIYWKYNRTYIHTHTLNISRICYRGFATFRRFLSMKVLQHQSFLPIYWLILSKSRLHSCYSNWDILNAPIGWPTAA